MPQCAKCKLFCNNRYLFNGKWLCMHCYLQSKSKRDAEYYKKLRFFCRIEQKQKNIYKSD